MPECPAKHADPDRFRRRLRQGLREKRRDASDSVFVSSLSEREEANEKRLIDDAINHEMAHQLDVMFARLNLLEKSKNPKCSDVHYLLFLKRLGVDLSFEQIAERTGVSAYMVKRARATVDEFWPALEHSSQKAIRNLARRLRQEG